MSIQSTDILITAEACLGLECESGYRSCTSRAYYAMYHETLASLQNVPAFSSNHHGNLIGYMTTHSEHKTEPFESMRLKVLGYNLKQQRDSRNDADYDLKDVNFTKEMAETSLEAAKLYFEKWDELRTAKAS
ncbi:hypothetical protein ACP3S7_04520 [Phytobacter ursingii]|nr:hypothetical protein C2U55_14910 [Enterobacteriaceae bacterium ENNIH3]AUV09638.1 hypothetical protein C2U52_26985 [Enterobacteriaceae bacterium ENNIH2]